MASIKVTDLTDKGIVILQPKGNFVGGDETDELRDSIKNYSELENKKLIIDLGDVLYLNSTGKIKLCQLNKNLENLFVITKLALIFDSYPSQEEAIQSFE